MRLALRSLILSAAIGLLSGCSEQGPAREPAAITAASILFQSGTVGQAVIARPSVRVLDDGQSPVRGATVEWTVLSGGGSLGSASSTTNSDGVATVSSWTLGTAAGSNVLRASAGEGIETILFEVEAAATAAANLIVNAGGGQTALAGQTLPIPPAVKVRDQFGNGVPAVQVVFSVLTGGGEITGPIVTTNSQGIATVGSWRLGALTGQNALSATVQGLAPIQILATAGTSIKCNQFVTYTLLTTVNAALDETDCLFPNAFYHDLYQTTVATTRGLRFTLQSSAMDSYLLLADVDGNLLAENNNGAGFNNSLINIIAAPGQLVALASSAVALQLGSYSLISAADDGLADNCELLFVMRGITVNQSINTSDCIDNDGPYYYDQFGVHLTVGVPVTITMTSTAFDTFLQLIGSVALVAENDDISLTDTNSQITFTPTGTGYYFILPSSSLASVTGPYTLTISPSPASGAAVRTLAVPPASKADRTLEAALIRMGAIRRR